MDPNSSVNPAYLLEFLENALKQFEKKDPRIKEELMERRATIFSMASQVSVKFPYPDEHLKQWHAMHEHIRLVDATLLVIQSGTRNSERFFSHPNDFAMGVMHSLLRIAMVADRWTELPVERQERYPNPDEMRTKAVEVATDYLNSFGKMQFPVVDKHREKEPRFFAPLYEMQKRILGEFVDMCSGMQSALLMYFYAHH